MPRLALLVLGLCVLHVAIVRGQTMTSTAWPSMRPSGVGYNTTQTATAWPSTMPSSVYGQSPTYTPSARPSATRTATPWPSMGATASISASTSLSMRAPPPDRNNWYISPSGSNSNSGNTPNFPFRDLQTALRYSAAGDVIHAAAGTYTGSSNVGLVIKDRSLIGVGPDTIFQGSSYSFDFSVQGKSIPEISTMLQETDTSKNYVFTIISTSTMASVQRICIGGAGTLIFAPTRAIINNLTFQNGGIGLLSLGHGTSSTDYVKVIDTQFDVSVQVGIAIRESMPIEMSNSQVNSPVGVHMGMDAEKGTITNTAFFGSPGSVAGIIYKGDPYYASYKYFVLSDCLFQYWTGLGQMTVGTIPVVNGLTVRSNDCRNCSVLAYEMQNVVAEDNQSPCLLQLASSQGSLKFLNASRNAGPVVCGGTVYNSTFTDNRAVSDGGAVQNAYVYYSMFRNNRADRGGAMRGGSAHYCVFENNKATNGGALYGTSSYDSAFNGNQATEYGGALYLGSASGCVFYNNSAVGGGALYDSSGNNCVFSSNHASQYGGGIYIPDMEMPSQMTGNLFINNTAGIAGGGYSGQINTISNFSFIGNSAPKGGGMCMSTFWAYKFYSSAFERNTATTGGGLYVDTSGYLSYFYDFYFSSNTARDRGGAVYFGSSSHMASQNITYMNNSAVLGGATYYEGSAGSTETGCVYTRNRAVHGGAIYSDSSASLILRQDNLIRNKAFLGGAIFSSHTTQLSDSFSVYNLNGAQHGGACWIEESTLVAQNVTYTSNNATMGGAVWLQGQASANFTSCAFGSNTAMNGTSVYCEDSTQTYPASTFDSQSDLLNVECQNCTTSNLQASNNCLHQTIGFAQRSHRYKNFRSMDFTLEALNKL